VELIVETNHGKIRGSEGGGIFSFKGVPYAAPPLGRLRFQPPAVLEPWIGVRDTRRPGPVPIQASLPILSFLNAGGARQSEDCLYLNVWSPGLDDARRPVLVWIHGGGFLIGAGSTPVYSGHDLAERGDMVVVTINYRLGGLGFLHLNEVRDQIAALDWVHENIAAFGGDPGNVTVCGQSAGAMSIGALLGAPRARPLFHRAICQSGAAENCLSQERANTIAECFLGELGLRRPTPRTLEKLSVKQILRAQGAVNRRHGNLVELMVLAPCVDGDVVPEPPLDAVRKGKSREIPLLIGTTLDEWKLFTPLDSVVPRLAEKQLLARFRDILGQNGSSAPDAKLAAREYREAVRVRGGDTSPFGVWSAYQSARVFHYPAANLAEQHSDAGGTAYSYLFSWGLPAMKSVLGSCHAMDLPFIFGLSNHPLVRPFAGLAAASDRLSHRMQDAWIGFASSGDPSHSELPKWDRYDSEHRATMLLDRECFIADAPLEAERRLLQSWS